MRPLILPLALLCASASAQAFEVVHEPLGCVPVGRYARVVARSAPEGAATGGEAQFRTGPDAGWYRVRMEASDGAWQAFLPRPTGALAQFEYRVVLFAPDASTSETPPATVTVAEACLVGDESAAAAAIVLQVPPGAPVAPPVPPGFSPVGASLPQEERRQASHPTKGGLGTRLVLGVGLAGVAGGAAALASQREDAISPSPPDASRLLPSFRFTGTLPEAGATISRGRDTFGVIVTMDREPAAPLPIQFNVGLQDLVNGTRCANMAGTLEAPQQPLGLVLSGPVVLVPGALCGDSFDVRALVLQVTANQRTVIQGTVPLGKALRFDP